MNINLNFLSSTCHKTRHAVYHAINLNRLKNKQLEYEPHKCFLTKCLGAEIVPKGFVLDFELTVGYHNHEFLDNWFGKLKYF